jgi:aspartate carbamoyltransferase catalytic subunit
VLPRLDILYMTRLQKERFNPSEIHEFDQCILRQKDLKTAKSHLKILHPLPRVDELSTDVDDSPHAYYFQQAANAVAVRQALLHLVLSDKGAELR